MLGLYVSVPIACFRKGLAREYLETEPLPPPSTCYGFLLSLVGETDRTRHIGCRVTAAVIGRPELSVILRTVWRVKSNNGWYDSQNHLHLFTDSDQKRFRAWSLVHLYDSASANSTILNKLTCDSNSANKSRWTKLMDTWIYRGQPDPPKGRIDDIKKDKDVAKTIKSWESKNNQFIPALGAGENARPDYQQLLTGVELIVWLDSTGEENGTPNLEKRVAEALDPTRRGRINRFGGLSLGESTHMVNDVRRFDGNRIDVGQNSTAAVFLIAEKGRMTLPVWVDHVGSAGTRYVTGNLVEGTIVAPEPKDIPVIQPK